MIGKPGFLLWFVVSTFIISSCGSKSGKSGTTSTTGATSRGGSNGTSNGASGGGGGGNNTPSHPTVVTCIDSGTQLPSQPNVAPDDLFYNYTSPSGDKQIFGYKNPKHMKMIKISNSYTKPIYPVIYSPTPFNNGVTTMSRIFVGTPSCQKANVFYAGIPSHGTATVYVPKQMWDAGHVKIFTEVPPLLQEDTKTKIVNQKYVVDTDKSSPNYGDMLYTSSTPNDFPLDYPFQLTEYTFESTCHNEDPSCTVESADKFTVDYDISEVDQAFLPVALQEATGSRGYVGSVSDVPSFQKALKDFVTGADGSGISSTIQWPYYYGSQKQYGYGDGLIKIPMGYNVLNSIMSNQASSYDNSQSLLWAYFLPNLTLTGNANNQLSPFLSNISQRWQNFWNGNNPCPTQADPTFCNNFKKTMNFLYINIENACQYSAGQLGFSAQDCLTPANPRSVATDTEKIRAFLGYTPAALTFSDSGQLAAQDPDNICQDPPNTQTPSAKNGQFYSNCLRDSVKSVLRGVPYPFWQYENSGKYYPVPTSIYNLDPPVWLIHEKLHLATYAFSVDDDIGNQEVVGNGIAITVGGSWGLPKSVSFNPNTAQVLAFPGRPGEIWKGTVSSSTVCNPQLVSACDLNIRSTGGFQTVDVSLTDSNNNYLKFTIGYGGEKECKIGNQPSYQYDSLKIVSCSSNLKNCDPGLLFVSNSNPANCAQTVVVSPPTAL